MNIPVTINIPYLWNGEIITKNDWAPITFLVGPNGTGKTQFAENIRHQLNSNGVNTRYLNAERLAGLEKQHYTYFSHGSPLERGLDIAQFNDLKSYGKDYGLAADAWIILKEKLDVRLRIEAVLSQFFGRTLRLSEEGGFLNPKLQLQGSNGEYGFRSGESHGLKELISILAFIYDDEHSCLILDEPELHLHPQYQSFLLSEIRKVSGDPLVNPDKKSFVIITHSPFFIDINNIDDLKNLLIFQPTKKPVWISDLDEDDVYRINKVLPRLNTHHKQFFFATKPIFVEGYTDQILLNTIQDKRKQGIGVRGISIIDVGGKNEVDAFYRLSKKLNLDSRAIVDYDVIFDGKLKQTASQDPQVINYLSNEGIGQDLMQVIGTLLNTIDPLTDSLLELDLDLLDQYPELKQLIEKISNVTSVEAKRRATLLGVLRNELIIRDLVPHKIQNINLIIGKTRKIIDAFKKANIFVLPKGELENYLPSYEGNPYNISDNEKSRLLECEREFLLSATLDEDTFIERYGELITIIDEACETISIDLGPLINAALGDFIHHIQKEFKLKRIMDVESIKTNNMLSWQLYSRVISNITFTRSDDTSFVCRIQLNENIDSSQTLYSFTETTVPSNFNINEE
ncbi:MULTISPECIES: ATP-dependent nuclease [Bacillus]|uniref:ATP-dependent nuclease n=1 Tax=Bacillus TaxID=1386 RepID=UPI0001A18D5A|nr:TOPRIM nucleotidyl transferase/hydrolase domain-containing protein [Bacillus pseudomycoides]EEM14154.1 hypothetical protein bpmyx0001_49680 [Bacillus pseudomycoides DSM 12442]MED1599050.1 AAA family ATPase [Bacillus pseudomycoides]MED4713188.1 AAA family ATPase [Bacillus pseudomycoides]OOR48699.1 ATP-dependent endonuclease [Bacillus pseudomycoides]PDY11854.1 ATP-dependent endonuclease [Bacillus pseudomycoides]